MRDKILKLLINIGAVLAIAFAFYKLIKPYMPRGMLDSQIIIFSLTTAVLIMFLMKISESNRPDRKKAIQGLEQFKYPQVNKQMLSEKPEGVVFGKNRNKYVRKRPDEDGHVLIIGGSGSGKSSCLIIPTLLASKDIGSFCIDIKGELSYKASEYTDKDTVIFNPLDRFGYGYDVFYALNENSTSQEVFEVCQNVVNSLIALSASEQNPFWKTSARNLLLGLMINYYRKGVVNFIDILDEILSRQIKEQVEDIINEGNITGNEYKLLIQFMDLADDTLSGVVTEMINNINFFAVDNDIRYSLRDNPKMMNPLMIEEQKHIFIVIQEHMITSY